MKEACMMMEAPPAAPLVVAETEFLPFRAISRTVLGNPSSRAWIVGLTRAGNRYVQALASFFRFLDEAAASLVKKFAYENAVRKLWPLVMRCWKG
jgi:hypothetical protein